MAEEAADLAAAAASRGKGDNADGDVDAASRLTYEIFSLLESKFLFGGCNDDAAVPPAAAGRPFPFPFPTAAAATTTGPPRSSSSSSKVCVLSIDGGGGARTSDGLLAAAALVRLESSLRRRSGDPAARLADFFDVAAGSGAGGVLATLLFARGPHTTTTPTAARRPAALCSADDALAFLLRHHRRRRRRFLSSSSSSSCALGRLLGDLTLRDTLRPVLVPCYDAGTRAPFLFSRADAHQSAAHDFRLRDVCAATCADGGVVEVASVDGGGGSTRVRAVGGGGGVALGSNPTAAAITHVLNNKREFPDVGGVGDLLVLSIGTGAVVEGGGGGGRGRRKHEVASIAAEGISDMVDQAVAMAFGHSRTTNYVRIQGTGGRSGGGASGGRAPRACGGEREQEAVWKAEAMLLQRSVESVLFQGRKLAAETNADKLERFARELAKEHARRKKQQQQMSPGGDGGGGGVSATTTPASNNDDKQKPATATAAAPAVTESSAGTPVTVAPRRRRRQAAAPLATKQHATATSRADDGVRR